MRVQMRSKHGVYGSVELGQLRVRNLGDCISADASLHEKRSHEKGR